MFHMRKEGEVCRQGFNFMFDSHLQIILFIGLYKKRYQFGIGYSRYSGKIYNLSKKTWTMEDDIKSYIWLHNYVTLEDAMEYRHMPKSHPLKEPIEAEK